MSIIDTNAPPLPSETSNANQTCSGIEQACPSSEDETAVITQVEFLDGDENTFVTGTKKQFVNITPRDRKWIDPSHITNKDRLTQKPRIKVVFDKPGNHSFKLRFSANSDPEIYDVAEKGRNSHFKRDGEKSYTTTASGEKIIDDFQISAGADITYEIEAEDSHGNKINTGGKIKSTRQIYCCEIKMTGLTSVANSLSTLKSEYDANHIKIVELPALPIALQENIGTDAESAKLKSNAKTAMSTSANSDKLKYTIGIIYTGHLAVKNSNKTVIKRIDIPPKTTPTPESIKIKGPGLTNPAVKDKYLWRDIVTGESWFVSCSYLKEGGDPTKDRIDIPAAKCTPVEVRSSMSKEVSIDISALPSGKGTVSLKLNWVDRMRAGLAFRGENLVAICTRAWWQNRNTASQNEVMIHEIGHKVGMVVKGGPGEPNAVASHYDSSKGHVGNHCYHSNASGLARYDTAAALSNSDCVMYGSTNGKSAFCSNCKPAIKKVDISAGW